jgi:hypothetical protein
MSFQPNDLNILNFPQNWQGGNHNIKFKYDLNLADIAKHLGLNASQLIPYVMTPSQINRESLVTQERASLPTGSQFGLPVFNQITLWPSNDPSVDIVKYAKLNTAFITVNQKKNIIKTPVPGYRGTVKEILSIYDYDIKIEGIFAGNGPENYIAGDASINVGPNNDILNNLIWICNYAGDINIGSDYLQKYGITLISIDEAEFNQSKDYSNLIYYKITCCDSDILPIAY